MQGFKKTLVALLAVAMVLSLVGPVFAAPADVEGTKYEDAAVRLIALGIFKGDDKGNFNPDDPISRAEATAVVIRALGLEKSADLMNGVTKFADVNADPGLQWATGAVNVAVSSNIVNGYPDGNFGGRDNVTYAQLAKMILYALNYGVTVEGGVWPTAVLAKADDLDILDGMTVVADAPITRGDAAKMLDNSLDVKALRQTGYGDLKQYEEDGKTLLERMGLDEIEGRVVEVPAVQNALDDNEVVIEVTKENGTELKDSKEETYEELEGVDVQGFFGLKVRAWVKDDEIVFVENKTAAKDVYTDTVEKAPVDNDVTLHVLDDEVTFASDAVIYRNNEKVKVSKLAVGDYGRFVKDKNKVVFANVFNFTNNGVVTDVADETVKYFGLNDTERKLELGKADNYTVYNSDFSIGSLEDVEKDSVLFWWRDGDDYYVMVVNNQVEGTLKKAADNKLTIDSKGYDTGATVTWSDNDDEDIDVYDEAADVENLLGESVVALLDLKGHVRHIRGDAKGTSGTIYGVAVDNYRSGGKYIVRVFTKDDEEVEYPFEERNEWSATLTDGGYVAVKFKLNADGEIAKGTFKDISVTDKTVTISKFDDKDDYFAGKIGGIGDAKRFFVDDGTVIMNMPATKSDDPEVVTWKDVKGSGDVSSKSVQVLVVGDAGLDAKFVVFTANYDQIATEDRFYGVVTGAPALIDTNKWAVDVDVFGEGEDSYVLVSGFDRATVKKGTVIAFKLDAAGKIKALDTTEVSSEVVIEEFKTGRKYVKFVGDGEWYRLASDAVVYDTNSKGNLNDKIAAADLDVGDKVIYALDGDKNEIRAAKVTEYAEDVTPGPGPVTEAKISVVKAVVNDAAGTEVVKIEIPEDSSEIFKVLVTGLVDPTTDKNSGAPLYLVETTTIKVDTTNADITSYQDGLVRYVLFNEADEEIGRVVVTLDTTEPTLVSAKVNGKSLVLTYDEALDVNSVPAKADFTVKVAASEDAVTNVVVAGKTVTLTLTTGAANADVVTVDYVGGANEIQDIAGNAAVDLTAESVTNETPAA